MPPSAFDSNAVNHNIIELNPVDLEQYDTIIFDLGGVVLPLEYGATVRELSQLLSTDASQIYTQARQSELFDLFERGEINSAEFRRQLLNVAGVEQVIDDALFDAAWNALLGRVPVAHVELLRTLAQRKRTFLLSNTNEIHLQQFLADFALDHPEQAPFASLFERAYYSHEMGCRKPESRIYEKLIELHQLTPSRTLFLDDNPDNITGAQALGIHALLHPSNASLLTRFEKGI